MYSPPRNLPAFSELEARIVSGVLAIDPIAGTQLGFSGQHNERLPPTDRVERVGLVREIERAAADLADAYTDVRTEEGLDAAVAAAGARSMTLLEEALQALVKNPGWYVSTALDGLYGLFLRRDLSATERTESVLARLQALPGHLDSARRNLNRPASLLTENAIGDTEGAIVFCNSELRSELAHISTKALQAPLQRALDDALASLAGYRAFLQDLPGEDGAFAAGAEAFESLLRDAHLLPFDASDLFALGNDLTEALSDALAASAAAAFGTPDWWEPLGRLSENVPEPGRLLDTYQSTLNNVRTFVTEHGLLDLSTVAPIYVVATPMFARTNLPFAAYVGAPPFGAGKAEFWVTPIDETLPPADRRSAIGQHHLGRMLVACIHEAFPGHHVEFTLSNRVRRPLRHLFRSTIFTEGWAFYCEHLMEQSGFLDRFPESAALGLAFQRDQLWRALRIVIDVGLHCRAMSPRAAAALLVDSHVMTPDSADSEIRYSCSAPTQPLSYMVGRRLFEELVGKLRQHPEHAGRPLSDLRMEVLRHGPVPLSLLARHLSLGEIGV